ncbi:MAG: transposase [Elusimicrobia bacterium RIFCSPLOWO2_12_FULL_59_9]|nr:MAG: transposase [Elusimicrobia bacterium RIFCSPLOWO2_12_FULL_59_9]
MNSEYKKWRSSALGRDMEMKVYGRGGKPIVVFPSAGGRFFEYEDFGMVEALRPFLEQGRAQLFAVDGVDGESWVNQALSPADRVRRHEDYERYVLNEAVPFIRWLNGSSGSLLTTGCSMGGYHAANFFFRHPEVFDGVISLSALYGPKHIFGDDWDPSLYYHFPLAYLPGLETPHILGLLRRGKIVLCVGQGDWEACGDYDCIGETRAMKAVLDAKGIPCWVDFWGVDVHHDWTWWRRQMPYFLDRIL